MSKLLCLSLGLGLGVAATKVLDLAPAAAEANRGGGDSAGGADGGGATAAGNGDVNGSGAIDISDVIYLASWLFTGGAAPVPLQGSRGLPATGQQACFTTTGGHINCADDTCPGQDGRYQAGCPSEGRFVDNGDGTVTDNCTGLMWQQSTADVNGDGLLFEELDALPWCEALAYCENLSFAGHGDWRLPNVRELESLVDYERYTGPAIDPIFISGASASAHWSSTSVAGSSGRAWIVSFLSGGGGVFNTVKFGTTNVLAVRSGP
jgi:hypothetical protein